MSSSQGHFEVRSAGDSYILRLTNPQFYNTDDYADFQDELLAFADERKPRAVVVDFEEVTYCSTAVINGLIQLSNRLSGHGGSLKLAHLSSGVREAFHALRLDESMFRIYDSTGAALADS